jgi:Protein of unknown function (DUF2961)
MSLNKMHNGIILAVWLVAILVVFPTSSFSSDMAKSVKSLQQEVADLHVLRDYITHKNSFILGQETLSGLPPMIKPGVRKTMIDIKGTGSLRHIWETHSRHRGSKGVPYILEFFIDGEKEPSIQGDLSHIIAAAQRCQQPFTTQPGGVVAKKSLNLYLPIPFERSLRVDFVATEKILYIFSQWDYRSGDNSMKGIRLRQQGEGKNMQLVYTGEENWKSSEAPAADAMKNQVFEFTGNKTIVVQGPGIIRKLRVNALRAGTKLRIRFDDEDTAAVNTDLADFFGPYSSTPLRDNSCYLPMPFRNYAEIDIIGAEPTDEWKLEIDTEKVKRFNDSWGYFHAKSNSAQKVRGCLPYPVLYTHGRGHWVGMSLYDTGSNHGGGDFTVIDGVSDNPLILHGINAEDYFSFAWHGLGKNPPYSEAVGIGTGRVRIHMENPYVFHDSLDITWSVFNDISPRSVAYWYQDSPVDMTFEPGGLWWDVFGPVHVPTTQDGNTPDVSDPDTLFAGLPTVAHLDAGKEATAEYYIKKPHTGVFKGWAKQKANGPHLNLSYIYRHVIDIGSWGFLGYEPRAMMASTMLTSSKAQAVTLQLSYDDPIQVWLNGELIHSDMKLKETVTTKRIKARLKKGENRLLIKLLDTPNINDCWAGINLRVLDTDGKEISASLQKSDN